jgi:DNA-binding MarR family transcriptional regulator
MVFSNGEIAMRSCLASLLVIQKQYQEVLKKMVKNHGLTIAEWQLLVKIINGNHTQERLAELTNLNVSTLSRQLAKLVAKHFVDCLPDNVSVYSGGRKKINYIETSKGKEAVKQLHSEVKIFAEKLFEHWSKEEQDLLQILLNRLSKSFERF